MVYLYTVKLSGGDAYAGLLHFSRAELKLTQSLPKAGAEPPLPRRTPAGLGARHLPDCDFPALLLHRSSCSPPA